MTPMRASQVLQAASHRNASTDESVDTAHLLRAQVDLGLRSVSGQSLASVPRSR
jgi:hypothetical protein